MAEQNLLRHMAVRYWAGQTDGLDLESAYRAWSALSEDRREELRAAIRPLLPLVTAAAKRALSAEEQRDEYKELAGELVEAFQSAIAHNFPADCTGGYGCAVVNIRDQLQPVLARARELGIGEAKEVEE